MPSLPIANLKVQLFLPIPFLLMVLLKLFIVFGYWKMQPECFRIRKNTQFWVVEYFLKKIFLLIFAT